MFKCKFPREKEFNFYLYVENSERPTISNMAIAKDELHGLVVQKTLRVQMLARVVDNLLEGRERNGDVVFIGFTLFRDSLCDSFSECPQRRKLCRRLGHDTSINQGLVGSQ